MNATDINLEVYLNSTGIPQELFPELTNPIEAEEFNKAIYLLHHSKITVTDNPDAIKVIAVNIKSSLSYLVNPTYNFCCTDEEISYIIKLYNVINKIPKYRAFTENEMYFILITFIYTFKYINENRFIDNINEILFKEYISKDHYDLANELVTKLVSGTLNVNGVNVGPLIMWEIMRRQTLFGGHGKIGPNRGAIKLYKRKSRKSRKLKKSRKHRAKN